MRRKPGKKNILLAAAALAATLSLTVGSAMAYFTTYTTASGKTQLELGFTETKPNETIDSEGKHVTIENIGDYDCYVRVKVFSSIEVQYVAGDGWTQGDDGYWYYGPVLSPGEKTTELLITYTYPDTSGENPDKEFDIVVVQECTPVAYDEEGNPTANWDHVIAAESTE